MASVSPYQMMVNQRYGSVPAMGTGAPEDAMAKARRLLMERIAAADTGTDPRMAEIMGRREQRIADQERELARFEKPSVGQTLQRIGAALLANQSPFLGVAVGNALNQNLAEQQARRTEVIRRRMALGEQRDALDMERINAEGAGRRRAVQGVRDEMALAGDMLSQEKSRAEIALANAKLNPDPRIREMEIQKAALELREIESRIRENNAQAARASRPDGGGGRSDVEGRADRAELDKAAARFRNSAARYEALRQRNPGATMAQLAEIDAKTVDDYVGMKAELEGLSGAFEGRYGSTPYIGGSRPSRGPLTPAAPAKPATTKGWSIKPL